MSLPHKPVGEQVILVTGASSGIGLCTAQRAAELGARVVLVARSLGILESLAERITSAGGQAMVVDADVGDRLQMLDAARAAVARFGRIDSWINNAGVSIYGRLDQVHEADARRLFDTNFWGVVNGSLAALPFLREQGGALVNVGSDILEAELPLQGYFSASKQAVKGFTDALRLEIEEMDQAPVSITLVLPTAVNTPCARHACNYLDCEPLLSSPMVEPEDVAEVILRATTEGGREIRVGPPDVMRSASRGLHSGAASRLGAPGSVRACLVAEPEGTLFRPGGEGLVHGSARG